MRTLSVAFILFCIPSVAFAGNMYADADGDGFGNAGTVQVAPATLPAGYVADGTDCNDSDADINPGEADLPWDGIDQDCSGSDARRMPTSREAKAFGKTKKTDLEILGQELARCEASSAHCTVVYTTPPACTGSCQETAEFTMGAGYFFVDLAGDGVVGRVVVNEDDKSDDARMRAYRGSGGGVSKKTVDATVEASATALRTEMAAEFTRDRARLDNLETYTVDLSTKLTGLHNRVIRAEETLTINTRDITTVTGWIDDAGEHHPGLIEKGLAMEATARNNVDVGFNRRINALEGNGLTVLASAGGFGGLQRSYVDEQSGNSARGAGIGGGSVGAMMGGRFGQNRFGAFADLMKASDGSAWLSGLEYTYSMTDVLGAGAFVAGGSHESGGVLPVECSVIGRYGLVGFQGAAQIPSSGFGRGEALLRVGVGVESFGTKFEGDDGPVPDSQTGFLGVVQLQVRGGFGY